MKLQNFCIDHADGCISKTMTQQEKNNVDTLFQLWMRTNNLGLQRDVEVSSQEKSVVREKLAREVRDMGLTRPAFACPDV